MNIIGIIPARLASSRFPGKPLARLCGIPMLGHTYFRSKMSKVLKEVYVATCDEKISQYIKSLGGKVVMTANTHKRASDRTAEAMLKIEKERKQKIDIVVMIQGDEPLIYPEMITGALKPMLEDNSIEVVNLMSALKSKQEQNDSNLIKVVVDINNYALYFSREPIPSVKKIEKKIKNMYKQVPIIPFKRDFLIKFNRLNPTPLEAIESIDMLRILEHGYKVKMVLTKFKTQSVDTSLDLKKAERLMRENRLFLKYFKTIHSNEH